MPSHRDSSAATDEIDISVVIPLHNERDNVAELYEELAEVMGSGPYSYEAIFVDDGSKDGTFKALVQATAEDRRCTVVELTRNFGQTAALAAGFEIARGRYIVPMDGDLQNDPHDIPVLIAKLDEPPGYDVVSGWRKNRQDRFFSRRLPSVLANRLIGRVTGVRIKDLGCTLKAYRREVIEDVDLYGEMHRFLPIITRWRGARIAEQPVNHRPRIHGTTKYDLRRTIKVLLDLITVKFLGGYLTKPIYFFGKAGLLSMTAALGALAIAVFQKFGYLTVEPVNLNRNVLVMLSAMLVLMTVMFIMLGVVSELLVRIYHESQDRKTYRIRNLIRQGSKTNPREGRDDTEVPSHQGAGSG